MRHRRVYVRTFSKSDMLTMSWTFRGRVFGSIARCYLPFHSAAKQLFELVPDHDFKASSLHQNLQNVDDQAENWAQNPYVWDRHSSPVSSSSWRVTQRFTRELATAKVCEGAHGIDDRDREMLMFSKANNHGSIVRYHMATELQGVPAAITDMHQGMISFAALEPNLSSMHQGIRLKLAADMFRPLFSALEWLHYNRIIHASVAPPSVLVQMTGEKLLKVVAQMRREGAQAIAIIETCSNFWQLRQRPRPEWKKESTMAQLTLAGEAHFYLVQQECEDFFHRRQGLWQQEAGAVMLEALALQERQWAQARDAQINNAELLQVSLATRSGLQRYLEEWKQTKTDQTLAEDNCNSFVEVRGQPDLAGKFVPVEMLPRFDEAFGVTVVQHPETRQNQCGFLPSDFSRNTGRIVLAHIPLVAYASMSRTQKQVTHLAAPATPRRDVARQRWHRAPSCLRSGPRLICRRLPRLRGTARARNRSALHRAEPTVVDNTSVDLTRAPSSILGLITAATANASAQGWWPEDLSVVRALDSISFSTLPLTAGAHRPQSQLEQLSTSQSFFGDMRRLQPDGMSRGQFQHMTSSGTDVAAEMMPQLLSCGWGLWRRVMRRRRRMGMERA
ncbi:hypothetical protein PSPO01_09734 [Paraphaeosphaeria sporulosa]